MSICAHCTYPCFGECARSVVGVPPYHHEDLAYWRQWQPFFGGLAGAPTPNPLADFPEDTLVELDVTSDPADFGATHVLVYEDGTEELLCCDGDITVRRVG